MKKTAIYVLMASLFGALTGCGDDDNAEKPERVVTFLHNVVDAGELYFDGEERPYGRISFANFGNQTVLEEGDWDLEVKDENPDDSTDVETVFTGDFTVYDNEYANIYALSGKQVDGTIQSHYLKSALDEESNSYTSDEDADDTLIYINVANIHPQYPSLAVYFLNENETLATAQVDAEVEFGQYSEAIKLEKSTQSVVVVDKQTGDEVYNSGDKTIYDVLQQILILAQSPVMVSEGEKSPFRAYYFYGSASSSSIWEDGTGNSSVRILNAVFNQTVESVIDPAQGDSFVESALAYEALSDYQEIPVGQYDFETTFADSTVTFTPSYFLTSGMYETVVMSGRLGDDDELDTVKLANDKRALATKARVQFVHLAYQTDSDDYAEYNVHLSRSDSSEEIKNRVPELDSVNYLETGTIEKRVDSSDDVGTVYTLRVMDKNNRITKAKMDLTIKSGSNYQIALVEKPEGGGYQLIDLDAPK